MHSALILRYTQEQYKTTTWFSVSPGNRLLCTSPTSTPMSILRTCHASLFILSLLFPPILTQQNKGTTGSLSLSPSLSLLALLLVLSVFPHLHSVLVLKKKHRNHPLDFLSVSYQGRKYWSKVMMIYGCLVSRVYLNWLFLKPATLERDNNSFKCVTQYSFWTLISQKRTYLNWLELFCHNIDDIHDRLKKGS